ncbi:hypothetical protein VNO80_31569 [Phaseolus coccineus]|uniref:Uncharacterized protein n=1 Tax=Phaseolus coccineus TaxID=3886 RepID=A0AAN9L3X6_PHACN
MLADQPQFLLNRANKSGVVVVILGLLQNYATKFDRKFTLLEAWNALKRVHPRSQPNHGFAKILVELDQKLHGKVSMEWQQKKPMMKIFPICGKNVGLSSTSLKLHLQKSHKKLSLPSGSVSPT